MRAISIRVRADEAAPQDVGNLLLARGKISSADLNSLREAVDRPAKGLGLSLARRGLVSDQDLLDAFRELYGLPVAEPDGLGSVPASLKGISLRFLREFALAPLADDGQRVVVAAVDPEYHYPIEALELALSRKVDVRLATLAQVERLLNEIYGNGQTTMDGIASEIESPEGAAEGGSSEHLRDMAAEAPVIRLVNLLIDHALEVRATDIHIEPFEKELKVRYRIDGVLQATESPPVRSAAAVISRIKIMARMNIAERRLPQDGRIQLRTQGRVIDVRVATVPTMHGESVVLRILDKEQVPLDLDTLGMDADIAHTLRDNLRATHGIILVTGPTGSGKTTTLYSALKILNTAGVKILTVEDPVEYQLPGINQIQVKQQIGLGFASALRALVRQDPDIIMIGEMRDLETARIAVQSALTGHLVLSTVHTNDAGSSVTRLLDMGVEDYLLTSTLNCILAQRLVRVLCRNCRVAYTPPAELVRELQLDKYAEGRALTLFKATGCEQCAQSGYRGRSVIVEVMQLSDAIRRDILAHADGSTIQKTAIAEGLVPMRIDGLKKALTGITTIEEVSRVIQEQG